MYFARLILAGFFMGLANLVPGVSGGTMVLALGFYKQFIEAVAQITKFKFNKDAILFLLTLFGIAFGVIFLLAGGIKYLMELYRPYMLSLFIGLTLGGIPSLLKEIQGERKGGAFWFALLSSILFMALLAFVFRPAALPTSVLIFFLGGIIGSSAMILPGVSGSYLLLILGLYMPIISTINQFKDALLGHAMLTAWQLSLDVLIPFALGMGVGIILLSNFLGYLLQRFRGATYAALLGLLVGSVFGLYPFNPPPLDKLLKYSEQINHKRILKIYLVGQGGTGSNLVEELKKLNHFGVQIDIKKISTGIDKRVIDQVREDRGVIVSYGQSISGEVKKYAQQKDKKRVYFMVIGNYTFSWIRFIVCLLLVGVGFIITNVIGNLKKEN